MFDGVFGKHDGSIHFYRKVCPKCGFELIAEGGQNWIVEGKAEALGLRSSLRGSGWDAHYSRLDGDRYMVIVYPHPTKRSREEIENLPDTIERTWYKNPESKRYFDWLLSQRK